MWDCSATITMVAGSQDGVAPMINGRIRACRHLAGKHQTLGTNASGYFFRAVAVFLTYLSTPWTFSLRVTLV